MLGRNDTKRQFNQQRPSLLPMGGDRTNAPQARSALGSRQTYQVPQWPDRPQFQEPEQSFDIQRAMTAAIEAKLLPQEFNNILGQMGMVNQQERDQAIGEYSRELELYGDEMKRMEFERTEQAGIAKAGEERFQKNRKYGLDLAKGAREALGKERQYGLDLAGHELEKTKLGRKHKLDVAGHKLETASKLGERKEKGRRYGLDVAKHKLAVGSKQLEAEEKASRFGLDAAKYELDVKKEEGLTGKAKIQFRRDQIDLADKKFKDWREYQVEPGPEEVTAKKAEFKMEAAADLMGGVIIPGKAGSPQEGKFIIKVNGKIVDTNGKEVPIKKPADRETLGEEEKIIKKDTWTPSKTRSQLFSKSAPPGYSESERHYTLKHYAEKAKNKAAKEKQEYKGHETTIPNTDEEDYSKKNIRKAAEDSAKRLANKGKREERIKARKEVLAAVKNEDIPESEKTALYRIIDKAFKKITGDH